MERTTGPVSQRMDGGFVSLRLPRALAPIRLVHVAASLLLLPLLFGGGAAPGFWSDAFIEIASLPLLLLLLYRLLRSAPARAARWPLVLAAGAFVLPLLQLVPLPPDVWSALPGREPIVAGYRAAGMALPWLPVSLDPAATWLSLLALLPAATVFLATLALDAKARRVLVLTILAVIPVSVALDLLQMMGGAGSQLRFYAFTDTSRAVGFFANSNHNAAFLYCALPFAAAWIVGLVRDRRRHRVLGTVLAAMLAAAIIIGLALTRSRAGALLGGLAGLACIALVWRDARGRQRRNLLLAVGGANLLGLLIMFQFGFVAFSQRIDNQDVMQDLRWPVAVVASQAAVANLPLGTGMGTFVPVYRMFAPPGLLREHYVNHAHDDWLELWLDGGLPALVLIVGFLAWFGVAAVRAWRARDPRGTVLDGAFARAGSIVIGLLLLHSLLDYPLRSAAMMTVFALACALLVAPAPSAAAGEERA